jgi:hypothetical protein
MTTDHCHRCEHFARHLGTPMEPVVRLFLLELWWEHQEQTDDVRCYEAQQAAAARWNPSDATSAAHPSAPTRLAGRARLEKAVELALIYLEDGAPITAAERLRVALVESREAPVITTGERI